MAIASAITFGFCAAAHAKPAPEAVAKASLERDAGGSNEWRLERVLHVTHGALVRFRQTHAGLDVRDGTAAVRVDENGRVAWTHTHVVAISADSTLPRFSEVAAIDAAVRALPFRSQPPARAALMYVGDDPPVLAWAVPLSSTGSPLARGTAYVDAGSGTLLDFVGSTAGAAGHLANVYPVSPAVTPTMTTVTLDDLPSGATELVGPDFRAETCVDESSCVPVGADMVHSCVPSAQAQVGSDGSFLHLVPPADSSDPTDAFAEVQAYYHAFRFLASVRNLLADPSYVLPRPVLLLTNVQTPVDYASAVCTGTAAPAGSVLSPWDGGQYAASPGFGYFPHDDGSDWLMLGQGPEADCAYDADLVYHELTHGFAFAETALAYKYRWDALGADNAGEALHEAFADYLSAVFTNDPKFAEYCTTTWPAEELRSAANDSTCPSSLGGVPHDDGQVWVGTLWEIRSGLPESDRAEFDGAVITAFAALAPTDGWSEARTALAAEIELDLGPAARSAADQIFDARGVDRCKERIVDVGAGVEVKALWSFGAETSVRLPAPGSVQFKLDVKEPASEIKMTFDRSWVAGELTQPIILPPAFDGPAVELLLHADTPITWTHTSQSRSTDASQSVQVDPAGGGPGSVSIPGPFEPGSYYLQLANSGLWMFLARVRFEAVAAPNQGAAGDAGDSSGCGCSTSCPRTPLPAALFLLLGSAAWCRRKRRHGRISS